MAGYIPPWRAKTLQEYADALEARYWAVQFDPNNDVSALAGLAKTASDGVRKQAHDLPEGPARDELLTKASGLSDSAATLKEIASSWPPISAVSNAATNDVHSSLALQVSKAGGLLTFNGLLAALAAFLYDKTTEYHSCMTYAVAGLLTTSCLLSLVTIFSRWRKPSVVKSLRKDLFCSLRLEARRAWALNASVLFSAIGVVFVVCWLHFSKRQQVTPAKIECAATVALPKEVPVVLTNEPRTKIAGTCVLTPRTNSKKIPPVYDLKCQ
jgi:hypothetical protein